MRKETTIEEVDCVNEIVKTKQTGKKVSYSIFSMYCYDVFISLFI